MPPWLTEALKLLGFTTPLIYAAATYGFFHWLDKKASGPAKRAISGWLEPKEYDKAAVAAAVVELFDRVYTTPLLAWRAFFRSASITVVVTIIVIHELIGIASFFTFDDGADLEPIIENAADPEPENAASEPFFKKDAEWSIVTHAISEAAEWSIIITINIVSDYLALFIIRRWLSRASRPVVALLFGPLLGIVLVTAIATLRTIIVVAFTYATAFIGTAISLYIYHNIAPDWWRLLSVVGGIIIEYLPSAYDLRTIYNHGTSIGASNIAALVVHLWLPFFALCVGLAKGLHYFQSATKGAQWFLKRGKDHPFDALGLVAAPLVFIVAVAVQMLVSK